MRKNMESFKEVLSGFMNNYLDDIYRENGKMNTIASNTKSYDFLMKQAPSILLGYENNNKKNSLHFKNISHIYIYKNIILS